jgi:hypothetical protein
LANANGLRSVEWIAGYDRNVLRPVSVEGGGEMSAYRMDEANSEILFAMANTHVLNGNAGIAHITFEVLQEVENTAITTAYFSINEADNSDSANEIILPISYAPTGIDETGDSEFAVTQRNGELQVVFSNSKAGTVKIALYDLNGRTIASQTTTGNSASFDMPSASGIYIVRLTSGATVKTQKVVVK